jgi:hypothetical protein
VSGRGLRPAHDPTRWAGTCTRCPIPPAGLLRRLGRT